MSNFEVTQRSSGVTIVKLVRPPVGAIHFDVVAELDAITERIESERKACAVVLTGSGTCFSAGVDTKEVPRYPPERHREMLTTINRMIARLYGLPVPVVAAVGGHAIGAGLVLALACDYRVVTESPCRLGLTEITVGIPFPACPMEIVRAELSPSAARNLVLTGREISPSEAVSLGVLDELASPDAVLTRAEKVAETLGALPQYGRVKAQYRAPTLHRMAAIVSNTEDPMLHRWL